MLLRSRLIAETQQTAKLLLTATAKICIIRRLSVNRSLYEPSTKRRQTANNALAYRSIPLRVRSARPLDVHISRLC
jgi:hypothetical protein